MKFFIGDLSHILPLMGNNSATYAFLKPELFNEYPNDYLISLEGIEFYTFNLGYGEGTYYDGYGNAYESKSGRIGVIRFDFISNFASKEDLSKGHCFDFNLVEDFRFPGMTIGNEKIAFCHGQLAISKKSKDIIANGGTLIPTNDSTDYDFKDMLIPLKEAFEIIVPPKQGHPKRTLFYGEMVKRDTKTLNIFKDYGCTCSVCGEEGTHFRLQCDNIDPHFNLGLWSDYGHQMVTKNKQTICRKCW